MSAVGTSARYGSGVSCCNGVGWLERKRQR